MGRIGLPGENWQRFPTRKGADFAVRYRGTEMLGSAPSLCKEVATHMTTAKPYAATRAVCVTTAQDHPSDGWASIDWKAASREVERLQQRIFRASQQKQWR